MVILAMHHLYNLELKRHEEIYINYIQYFVCCCFLKIHLLLFILPIKTNKYCVTDGNTECKISSKEKFKKLIFFYLKT